MEFTWGPPSVMRPVTGSADSTRAGALAVPGASAAPEYSLQAVAPRPLAATRHTTPLIGLPRGADLMQRTPRRADGEVTGLNLRDFPNEILQLLALTMMFAPTLDDAQEFGMLRQKPYQIVRLTTLYRMTVVVEGTKHHLD